jgi:hypothetical protein
VKYIDKDLIRPIAKKESVYSDDIYENLLANAEGYASEL